MMMLFAGEGWGEGMSQMVIDDEMWSRLEKLLPKPKGRHGGSVLLARGGSI
jgi:hypothetical protein